MQRIGAFCVASWLAAAILFLGRHSVPMIALSGVVVLAGFDLFRPILPAGSHNRNRRRRP